MSSTKPIKLYGHAQGPNPWKVVIVMEQLGIPYEIEFLDMGNLKKEPFVSVNPNGRVPAIEDPNTGVVVWESAAVIEYLLDNYDKENKLSYTSSPEKYLQSSWKHFQMSGQGPYFGQVTWFKMFHPDKVPSAVERYENEVRRVIGVIDSHLSKTGKPYLVGDKLCFADLMFVPWNRVALRVVGDGNFAKEWEEKYPKAWAWHQKVSDEEGVKKAFARQDEEMAKSKH